MTTINEHDELLRRVFHYHIKPDNTVASSAFMTKSKRPDPSCSVSLARITSPQALLAVGLEGQRVVSFPARVPMDMKLTVEFDPQDDDPGHCLIKGLSTKEQCVQLAAASRPIPL
jgi:hypothetical protein